MGEEAVPLLRRASHSLVFLPSRSKAIFRPRILNFKVIITICILLIVLPILFWSRDSLKDLSVSYPRPFIRPIPQFVADGDSQCLPSVSAELIQESIYKHATCRKFSPFRTGRARVATVTAHFGAISEHYQKAFRTHLLHSLIHGTEVRVMCDPIIDDLWNKPAFILNLLMRETMKPAKERLEWIMWADRDTVILDQCRPISSFLPPERSRLESWWHYKQTSQNGSDEKGRDRTEVNLLVTRDWNGLNNGVFFLRVNEWAISLFTAILAFRHYKPDVTLPFTEQSAMEHVLRTEDFIHQTEYVPQHWFNAYDEGGAMVFASRNDMMHVGQDKARKGDYLVHFAGNPTKAKAIVEYTDMLQGLPDVWENGTVQRDSSMDIIDFWNRLGY
ncbi:galactosyl transferase GMA12/MNN10 family-domain-containing protein [Phaeosphaeriaceae sp. PMI808]|nr:galactosyl transferase GMA12/MNN10 family-domain-containing protein [Phaeosphaeriaceae sp. PMI808]